MEKRGGTRRTAGEDRDMVRRGNRRRISDSTEDWPGWYCTGCRSHHALGVYLSFQFTESCYFFGGFSSRKSWVLLIFCNFFLSDKAEKLLELRLNVLEILVTAGRTDMV